MADIEQQAWGLIETCKTVISSPRKSDPPDANTITVARAILEQAKTRCPDDPVLQAIDFQRSLPDWPAMLVAMQTIVRSLAE